MKVYIETLGCKVNFADSADIQTMLINNSYEIVNNPEEADMYIVNSCSVTHRAERECRQIVRRFKNMNHNAEIIITGCSIKSEEFRERARDIEFTKLIPFEHLFEYLRLKSTQNYNISFNRSRPFIRIQSGCDRFCSYCIVPFLRGEPHSTNREVVIKQVEEALRQGYEEIVLVGTHIMLYRDPQDGCNIFRLISQIEKLNYKFRLRLSSIEPYGITQDTIISLAQSKRICGHFHIALQSGSNSVLRDMNRQYTREEFEKIISDIKRYIPYATIGSDVIVGFPTETERDFEETVETVKRLPIDYLHIFRFSPRKNTPAYIMKGTATQAEIRRRAEILKKISFEKKRNMILRNIGRDMDIVITDVNQSTSSGITDNYIKVRIARTDLKQGKMVRVRLTSINTDNTANGELI